MHRLSTSFILGYHGCSRPVAECLLAGEPFKSSENDFDWLGPGIYFWQANPRRALQFSIEKCKRESGGWEPAVVGAVVEPGLCLDLTTESGLVHVRETYQSLVQSYEAAGWDLPKNAGGTDLLLRKLDCAVIRMLHDVRKSKSQEPIDTVSGIFIEGDPIYDNSGFRDKTHIQICVCNPKVIKGIFRVRDDEVVA